MLVPFGAVLLMDVTNWDPYLGAPSRLIFTGLLIWFCAGLVAGVAAGTMPVVHGALTTLYLTIATVARGRGIDIWALGAGSATCGGAFALLLIDPAPAPARAGRAIALIAAICAIPMAWYAWTP